MKKRDYSYTQNRELSWLKFDERVLVEANDKTVPLLERLRFISIFTTNLDEFYMVRCGSLYDLTLVNKKDIDNKTGFTPHQQLNAIFEATVPLYKKRDEIYDKVSKKLSKYHITGYKFGDLSSVRKKYLSQYFYEKVMPLLSAQIIDTHHPFPHLTNKKLYIYSILKTPEENEDEVQSKKNVIMGLIPVPATLPRYVKFPETNEFILMEDLILAFTESVFSNYSVIYKTITSVTRNSDINLQQTPIDEDEDYRHYMKKILKKRKRLAPIRLEFYGDNDSRYTKPLKKKLGLHKKQVFTSQTPLVLNYIEDIIAELPEPLANELTFPEFTSQNTCQINKNIPILDQLDEKDMLLFYPYQSMDHFIDFLKESARDPDVLSIKITLYRVAKNSKVIKYLLEALDNGKEVTALIELRARFDEENNINNAELLEKSGVNIIYGFEEYKVHSKVCCVTKKCDNKIKYYTQIGTGNYNEKTAKLYTDYCYMTSNDDIGEDANEFFNNLSLSTIHGHYNKFLASPSTLRKGIIDLIDKEIVKAQNNEPAEILMKMNSLTDRKIIDKLAKASQKGVHIQMIIRGICCMLPDIPDKTENIKIKGIVGRFLEHSRVYAFGKGEDRIVYISSADIMARNTAKRVEIACPVEDPKLKNRIIEDLEIMIKDDIKGRAINKKGDYEKIIQDEHVNAQEYFQKRAIKEMKDCTNYEDGDESGVLKGKGIKNNTKIKNDNATSKELEETNVLLAETQKELKELKTDFNELKGELEKSIELSKKLSVELDGCKSLNDNESGPIAIKSAVIIANPDDVKQKQGFFSKLRNLFKF